MYLYVLLCFGIGMSLRFHDKFVTVYLLLTTIEPMYLVNVLCQRTYTCNFPQLFIYLVLFNRIYFCVCVVGNVLFIFVSVDSLISTATLSTPTSVNGLM